MATNSSKPAGSEAGSAPIWTIGAPPAERHELPGEPPTTVLYEVYGRLPSPLLRRMGRYQFHPERRLAEHDPNTRGRPGMITRETPVSTIGSCFVVAIKKWLTKNGYNYVQTEQGPGTKQGSARFGRVFNTASLRQVFERAYGLFEPVERYWRVGDLLLDPYRQGIGWPDERSAEAELEAHARAVREMVEQTAVMIFTIGVSEVWRNREDHAAFFRVPPEGLLDEARHEFLVLSVDENWRHLERCYELLRRHNPGIRLVVTLSPVPLRMTYRDMSCITADAVSKSILRVAIDQFCQNHAEVVYFPAFEIVRSLSPDPFLEDNRHVKPELVQHIMGCFMEHFGPGEGDTPSARDTALP